MEGYERNLKVFCKDEKVLAGFYRGALKIRWNQLRGFYTMSESVRCMQSYTCNVTQRVKEM